MWKILQLVTSTYYTVPTAVDLLCDSALFSHAYLQNNSYRI